MSLSGKVAMVVGATSGIGKAIAIRLAELKANVAVVARNKILGAEVVKDLQAINPDGRYELILCEATSMADIVRATDEFKTRFIKINYLVLSQGKISSDMNEVTSEGVTKSMTLFYYGRMLFIKQLEGVIRETSQSEDVRVMCVLSAGKHKAYDKLDDLGLKYNAGISNSYNAGGFYHDLTLDQFSRSHNQRVSFIHAYPGAVATGFLDEIMFPFNHILGCVFYYTLMTPEKCANTMVASGLLGEHMGATTGAEGEVRAGFHTMNEHGQESTLTALHTDLYREAVWKHTNEVFDAALKK